MATQLHLPVRRPKPISERFEGLVESLEGEVAYISLESEHGDRLHDPYPADELAARGVGERDRSRLTLIDAGDSVRFVIQFIPAKFIPAERQREIQDEIAQALEGSSALRLRGARARREMEVQVCSGIPRSGLLGQTLRSR